MSRRATFAHRAHHEIRHRTRSLIAAIFPTSCLSCRLRLPRPRPPLLLCAVCRGQLERLDPRACCRGCACDLPRSLRPGLRCIDCIAHPPPFDRLIATWRYAGALAEVVRALKFRRLDYLAEELVATAIPFTPPVLELDFDLVVPVPLAPLRRLERGFNQAERIARHLARGLDLPLATPLRRRGVWSTPQSRLGRAGRSERLDRRFAAAAARHPASGARILLVDDVVTTGATMRAAAQTLRRLGARSVTGWALAVTPLRDREPGPRPTEKLHKNLCSKQRLEPTLTHLGDGT